MKSPAWGDAYRQGTDYAVDTVQRWILFWDIIRKRGNAYLKHLREDQPPVLAFDYTVICDGRSLDRPVNYQLVRITDRRDETRRDEGPGGGAPGPDRDRRINPPPEPRPGKRPIVVMDPRAGHGPGIGGSKMDSQIGIALNAGHPVYFIMFLTRPVPGQTIADVQACQVHFLEQVARRHPDALKPAVIGNCQAGWAAALIAAARPDVTGPLVLNGSPLSYWGGVRGANPMRYRGGLFGGSWLASLSSDLGNGLFDGAHLVAGFEELNAANTFWTKQYNLYDKVDTEEKRFLDFEKWWGGFFLLSREEIRFIVNNLFISDELEQGFLKLKEGSYINLKNFKDPIVVFASRGDNITPPQQALNWITRIYKDVEDIKRSGQTIVYLLHDSIGHLGIFVSSRVTRKEHKEIIGCVDAIDFLAPGLYEMVIEEGPTISWLEDHQVSFEERSMDDILALDDGFEDEEAFQPVSAISKLNDRLYREWVSPWVRLFSNDATAEAIRQLHPLRIQRYGLSDLNPFLAPFNAMADTTRRHRKPVDRDNPFKRLEKLVSDQMVSSLEFYQNSRDALFEHLFYGIYGNDWMKTLFFSDHPPDRAGSRDPGPEKSDMFRKLEAQLWYDAMTKGGFEHGVVRIILAVTHANMVLDMTEYDTARLWMKTDPRLKAVGPGQLKQMILDQSALLEKDREQALETLKALIPETGDREAAVRIARDIAEVDTAKKYKKTAVLKRIEDILLDGDPAHKYSE